MADFDPFWGYNPHDAYGSKTSAAMALFGFLTILFIVLSYFLSWWLIILAIVALLLWYIAKLKVKSQMNRK